MWVGRRQFTVLGLALAAYFSTFFARVVLSPVVPEIITALDSSKSAIGLAFTGMWAANALVQYPGGALSDQYGEKRVVLTAIAATGVSSLLIAGSISYAFFFIAAVLIGAGTGMYIPAGTSLLTKRFPNTGQALGFHVAGANIAGLIAPIAAVYVAVQYGWRAAPILTVVLTVPLVVVLGLWIKPTPPIDPSIGLRTRLSTGSVIEYFLRPKIVFTGLIGVVGLFTFGSISSFLPTFLIEFRGLSTTAAGTAFGLVYLCSAITMPVMGWLSDRLTRDATIMFSFSAVAIGLTTLLVGEGVVPILVGIVIVGMGISWGGSLASRFMDHLADDERGTGFGIVRSITGVIGASGSVVVGTLADGFGWVPAYGLVVVLLLVMVVTMGLNRVLGQGW